MKYPELKGICKYCLYGCNKLEIPEFTGVTVKILYQMRKIGTRSTEGR